MLGKDQVGPRSGPHPETGGRVRPKVVGSMVIFAFPDRHPHRNAPLTWRRARTRVPGLLATGQRSLAELGCGAQGPSGIAARGILRDIRDILQQLGRDSIAIVGWHSQGYAVLQGIKVGIKAKLFRVIDQPENILSTLGKPVAQDLHLGKSGDMVVQPPGAWLVGIFHVVACRGIVA